MNSCKVLMKVLKLVLLSSFDTINQKLLLAELVKYGIKNNELNWFKSYLIDRCQSVLYDLSDPMDCTIGVPQ